MLWLSNIDAFNPRRTTAQLYKDNKRVAYSIQTLAISTTSNLIEQTREDARPFNGFT